MEVSKQKRVFYCGGRDCHIDRFLYRFIVPYISNKRNQTCIECGAFNGVTHSVCMAFEVNLDWKCINIEANPVLFKSLAKRRANSFLNLNAALTDKNGNIKFACGPKHKKLGHISEKGNYAVKGITYANLIESHKIESVVLFVLDVEGHEIQVLKGMVGCSVLPDVFCIENHLKRNGIDKIQNALDLLEDDYEFVSIRGRDSIFAKKSFVAKRNEIIQKRKIKNV